jgi:hypothetical protein
LVGRAVPLAFVFASVGILFVSYAFIRLTGFLSRRVRAWEAIVPVVALAILVYVIYANVYPFRPFRSISSPTLWRHGWFWG